MTTPRLIDAFCKAGGASVGYARAGFDVVGVDIEPQPHYPFEFHQADAFEYLDAHWHEFDVIAGSPPCYAHSVTSAIHGDRRGDGWMLGAVRAQVRQYSRPWVLECTPGAFMPGAITLCGTEFGLCAPDEDGKMLYLKRHRLFQSSLPLWGAGGCSCKRAEIGGNYGGGWGGANPRQRLRAGRRGGYVPKMGVRSALMGIDWMQREELSNAIPPAYTQFIGEQLIEHLASVAA